MSLPALVAIMLNGDRYNVNVDLGYRIQPYAGITLSTAYNDIQLPQPWGRTIFWLIGPRIDVTSHEQTFSNHLHPIQRPAKNINLNARLQWRYRPRLRPVSLCTLDNYYSYPLFVRNRAFVLKFTLLVE